MTTETQLTQPGSPQQTTYSDVSLAVLMTCHNRRDLTLRCLEHLFAQTIASQIRMEVFLVDDGSTDGTSAAVQNKFPTVRVIPADGSLFWNRGMHLAFATAMAEDFAYYMWLNDDSMLVPDALERLIDTHRAVSASGYEASIIGSAMQHPETGEHTYGGVRKRKTWWGRVTQSTVRPSVKPEPCSATNGNCVLIPRSVVAKVGNLDPIYQHRWGDHDYCFRAIEKGCRVWLAPGYIGRCPRNPIKNTWEDTSLPCPQRLKKITDKKAMHPKDYLIYLRRHRGPLWFVNLVAPYIKVLWQCVSGAPRGQP